MDLSLHDAHILRRWSVVAVVANIAATLLAAAVLPADVRGVLPVIALVLPLLTTGVLEAAAQHYAHPH